MNRLLLFDYDYTLVDASNCLFAALRAGLQVIGLALPDDQELKKLIGLPLDEQFRTIAPRRDEAFAEFRSAYIRERDATEQDGTVLIDGVHEALRKLREAGIRKGVVSTAATRRILRALTRYGILGEFDEVVGGAISKPHAITEAISRLGATSNAVVYVGDRPDDALAAERAGVGFIGVCTGAFTPSEFGDELEVVPSVADLPEYFRSKEQHPVSESFE